jgi:hypothetical protein
MSRRPAVNPSWLILHIIDALRVPSPPPHPADGYCSEALAVRLGIAAGVLAVGIFIFGALL